MDLSHIDVMDVFMVAFISALVFALGFGASAAILSAHSSGAPDYCFVSTNRLAGVPVYSLEEHRLWAPNQTMLVTFMLLRLNDKPHFRAI